MISYILSRINKKYPYHFSLYQDRVSCVFLIGEDLNENAINAMDLMEELGFKIQEQKKLPVATGGPKIWTQLTYHWNYSREKLPKGELNFIEKYSALNSFERRTFLNSLP